MFNFDEDLSPEESNVNVDHSNKDKKKEEKQNDDEMRKDYQSLAINEDTFSASENKAHIKCGPQDFNIMSVLGKGGYGTVYLVKKRTDPKRGKYFAMKVLKKAVLFKSKKDIVHTRSERNILETIQHPFIVKLIYAFQTNNKLYMIMEYLSGGELFMQLERNGSLPEPVARFYLAEITLALIHLHENGIIYRDLKPENIMLTRKGHIKLTDFGLSKESVFEDEKTNTFCGTIEYMAPEILSRSGHGPSADWWSFGTVLYDMLSGEPPFTDNTRERTINLILRGRLILHHYFSFEAKDLLKKLLRRNPCSRIGHSASNEEEIKRHPFFRGINWDDVIKLKQPPPYIPPVSNESDTTMFDARFTRLPAEETPCNSITNNEDIFKGFTYVAPNVVFDRSQQSHRVNNKGNTFYNVFGEDQK